MKGSVSSLEAATSLKQLAMVGDTRAQQLADAGLETQYDVADASVDDIADALGHASASTTAKRISGSATGYANSEDDWDVDVFEHLEQVGAHRAELLREAGFDTITDVAESSPADIADVLEIPNLAEWVAVRVFSSANRLLEEIRDGDDDVEPECMECGLVKSRCDGHRSDYKPNYDIDTSGKCVADRLLIIGMDDNEHTNKEGRRLLTNAVRRHGLVAKHVGKVTSSDSHTFVDDWYYNTVAHGGGVLGFDPADEDVTPADRLWTFDVEPHLPDDVFTGDHWQDKDDRERTMQDLASHEWAEVFEELRIQALTWATHLLIVDGGDFAWQWRQKADDLGVVVKDYVTDYDWEPEEDRGLAPDIDELETKHGADPEREDPADHFDDDYQAFNQWDGSSSEYEQEGNGEGSAGFII